MEGAAREGCTDFNKLEFLHVIHDVRRHTFKPSTVQKAFEFAGVWP